MKGPDSLKLRGQNPYNEGSKFPEIKGPESNLRLHAHVAGPRWRAVQAGRGVQASRLQALEVGRCRLHTQPHPLLEALHLLCVRRGGIEQGLGRWAGN